MQSIRTVVLDLDNTLWDWVDIWYQTFSAEFEQLVKISGLDPVELKSKIHTYMTRARE